VVAAATRLFRIKGYHATTMEDIAKRVGVRKGSLYHHIRSKEDILREILTRTLDRLIVMAEQVAASDGSPAEKLRTIIVRELQLAAQYADDIAVYLGEKARLPRRFARMTNEKIDTYDRIVEGIIQDGIRLGLWDPEEPKIALLAIMGMLNWWPYWFRPNGRLSVEETANLLADYAEAILKGSKYTAHGEWLQVPAPAGAEQKL